MLHTLLYRFLASTMICIKNLDPESGFKEGLESLKMSEKDKEDTRSIYGMVTNIDDNIGKLIIN